MQGVSIYKNNGVVLPAVLWITILTIAVAGNYVSAVHVSTRTVDNIKNATMLKYDSRSGVYVAIERLLAGSTTNDRYSFVFNKSKLDIEVWPERMKTSVNEASADKLQDAFIGAGIEPVKADVLAARVIDWRDTDHSAQVFGMEDEDYSAIDKDYGAKDQRFEDLAELLLLEGFDDDTFSMIKDYFTVYGKQNGRLYAIMSRASDNESNRSCETRVIVQLTNHSGSPYRILKWHYNQN